MSHTPNRLWTLADLIVITWVTIVSGTLLLLAWLGSSGTIDEASQQRWTAVGIAGLILSGLGTAYCLVRGRRALGRKLSLVTDAAVLARGAFAHSSDQIGDGSQPRLVASSDMTFFHREGCMFSEGKRLRAETREEHERAGRSPCLACLLELAS
ncbi:MAG: hypothetical protein QOD57_4258 [Actinomycetota bacterium]|jgi:hypothetical protein|nr:hypothetical protein [Actinomycetota bacterium]